MIRGVEQRAQDPREAGRQFAMTTGENLEPIITPIDLVAQDTLAKIAEFREEIKSAGDNLLQKSTHSIENAVTNARLLSKITPYVSDFFTRARDADLRWEGHGADGLPRLMRFGYSDGQYFGKDASIYGQVGLWFQRRTKNSEFILVTPYWIRKFGDDPYKKSTIQSLGFYGQAITLNKLEATIRPYSLKR